MNTHNNISYLHPDKALPLKIGVIGLGYVGLPLARLFATKYIVIGFDINKDRIDELRSGIDKPLEISNEQLQSVLLNESPIRNNYQTKGLFCTYELEQLKDCTYYIIAVPTPINKHYKPDLSFLFKASETVGSVLKKGDIVIYESTVYPGATEEDCVPILEKISGLKLNIDFHVGYSPERINPGDKEHTIEKIKKITSGSTPEAAEKIDDLYKKVITVGTYLAPTIRVAEAAKVIENAQRDINIAFVNELQKIFDAMDINTNDVLKAAATKWNFLPFKPGLVGGHCIGVDPYYLAQKAQEHGYHPEIILAGRKLNDSMSEYHASQIIKKMIQEDIPIKNANVLVLGITFKENCPDVRNSKVVDLILNLKEYKVNVCIYDPWAKPEEVKKEYGLDILESLPKGKFDMVVLAVTHKQFEEKNILNILKQNAVYNI